MSMAPSFPPLHVTSVIALTMIIEIHPCPIPNWVLVVEIPPVILVR